MVAIVLGILKLIGILILIVLGLVLAVIFSVLFVPVRYRAEGSCYESFKGKASVSWFFHLISLKAFYDGELHVDFRILWFHPGWEKSDGKAAGETPEENSPEIPEGNSEKALEENVACANGNPEEQKSESGQELKERMETAEVAKPESDLPDASKKSETAQSAENAGKTTEAGQKPKEHKSRLSILTERLRRFWTGWKKRICSIPKKLKRLAKKLKQGKQQWDTIWHFLQDEENKAAFRLAKKQIFGIIRHISPQKMAGKLRFGLGDPYRTGQVLTWISPFYPLYGRSVQVIPDFLETCLEGELKLKGRIRLATLLLFIFRVLQNKNIRLWIKKWREA
ncbi:DUF2953 domain-containing protein [Clostridium sp. AM42-4]|uniref:DUF2953 domain-containing protein n=1 Tax=Clostridium sp. AM42-4 TaxID=2292305 RepID=UPI000E51B691|nr:DUF2953 domain-containing protein [Clostridium sp. AM42-4]RHS85938.1 DUF2953 domain-containing protein [Clostridium sp. AM42-4]